jgi:hypothetical protein
MISEHVTCLIPEGSIVKLFVITVVKCEQNSILTSILSDNWIMGSFLEIIKVHQKLKKKAFEN